MAEIKTQDLPALPTPLVTYTALEDGMVDDGFSADQMRAYALAFAESLRTTSQPVGVPEGWRISRVNEYEIRVQGPDCTAWRFQQVDDPGSNSLFVYGLLDAMLTASPAPPAAKGATSSIDVNEWFCSLPEGRQAVLREDKWTLAHAAFEAGKALSAAPTAAGDEASQITLTAPQLRQALEFVNPDKGDASQDEDRLTIAWAKDGHYTDGETRPAGLYAWFTEYPEEGAIYLDPQDPAPEALPFEVRIAGPDDVIKFADELSAHRRANVINQTHVADCLKHPNDHVMCVATVHEAEAGKVGG